MVRPALPPSPTGVPADRGEMPVRGADEPTASRSLRHVASMRALSLEDQIADRLIISYQHGNAEAFKVLHDQFGDSVRTYLAGRLGCADDAQDVTQLVFLRVFQALPAYRVEGRPFRHWLFTVARNAAEDYRRRLNRSDRTPDEWLDRVMHTASPAPEWGSTTALHQQLGELPMVQRQVLTLRYRWQLTTRETGEVLGRPEATIRQIQSRALRELRRRLTPA